ncbi:MAG: type IV pilin protein [Candidatus Fimenecus sp.]
MKKRLFQNKKGFTLVELMIVVVIMGILTAIAIPVYSAVSKNAEKKTCHSNCEIIQKCAVQYLMGDSSDVNYEALMGGQSSLTIASQADAESKLPAEFLACFEDGEFPQCPTDGCQYTLTYTSGSPGTFTVSCSEHGDKFGN